MIIYDVNSFPKGIDINVWYGLFEKGLAVYDSERGEVPFAIDEDKVALIDIYNMSKEDLVKISQKVDEINKEYNEMQKTEILAVKENNRKLVEYLKSINTEK